jgi:excisionase family DNA binding protein
MPTLTLADLDGQLFADVPEVAKLLRSDVRTIRRAIVAGDIPAIRTGQRYRIPVSWLRKAAAAETSEAGS